MAVKHLNVRELSRRWGIKIRTLERWRHTGFGPCFLRLGGRVMYREEDIEEFERRHCYISTSQSVNPELEQDDQQQSQKEIDQ
ncbi:helix-turn-helix domain-containing protein [Endozoicomonas sp. Mp262]|uniref:helix-turn-helix domain-containing protein n=1 Tax=Endozoicomonas sp. Mp262 TaxID=2919499 RepID=UPI0021D86F94